MEIGGVKIDYLGHSGLLIEENERFIYVDPYKISDSLPKADFVFITHSHYDHCSIEDIKKIVKLGTVAILPADAQSKVMKIPDVEIEIIEPGDEIKCNGLRVEALAAYNLRKNFHPKQEGWVGYILKIGNIVVYHAGDSDKIPEMKKLTGYGKKGNHFIAFLPVSGKFVMDAKNAAEVASMISPDLCVPIHYGSGIAGTKEDAKEFVELCKGYGLNAKILEVRK